MTSLGPPHPHVVALVMPRQAFTLVHQQVSGAHQNKTSRLVYTSLRTQVMMKVTLRGESLQVPETAPPLLRVCQRHCIVDVAGARLLSGGFATSCCTRC